MGDSTSQVDGTERGFPDGYRYGASSPPQPPMNPDATDS